MRLSHQDDPLPYGAVDRLALESCSDQVTWEKVLVLRHVDSYI